MTFEKVLIVNRGEIAARIIASLHMMDITAALVYSDADRRSLPVRLADEVVRLPGRKPADTYLNQGLLLEKAQEISADAIHPGYGFLAENADFCRAIQQAGLTWIGPSADNIEQMGEKVSSRRAAAAAGLPIIPGTSRLEDEEAVLAAGKDIGFPLILKADLGGGGKGMRTVRTEEELIPSYHSARREAENAFGDPAIYIERYLEKPRHIEIQIVCDQHGNRIHLGERECSIQRRHQKLIEECPSPVIDAAQRAKLGDLAVDLCAGIDYRSVGTVEFMRASDGSFYFLEMNTRIQVEHPVTELVTGLDLIAMQIAIAADEPLPLTQEEVTFTGWAFECRLNAEDPFKGFIPSPGRVAYLHWPTGSGIRVDSYLYPGCAVPSDYDSLVAKLIVHGRTRAEAARRMVKALSQTRIKGIKTTLPLHERIFTDEAFIAGDFDTTFLDTRLKELGLRKEGDEMEAVAIAAALTDYLSLRKEGMEHSNQWKQRARLMGLRGAL